MWTPDKIRILRKPAIRAMIAAGIDNPKSRLALEKALIARGLRFGCGSKDDKLDLFMILASKSEVDDCREVSAWPDNYYSWPRGDWRRTDDMVMSRILAMKKPVDGEFGYVLAESSSISHRDIIYTSLDSQGLCGVGLVARDIPILAWTNPYGKTGEADARRAEYIREYCDNRLITLEFDLKPGDLKGMDCREQVRIAKTPQVVAMLEAIRSDDFQNHTPIAALADLLEESGWQDWNKVGGSEPRCYPHFGPWIEEAAPPGEGSETLRRLRAGHECPCRFLAGLAGLNWPPYEEPDPDPEGIHDEHGEDDYGDDYYDY